MTTFDQCMQDSLELNEDNDCGVRAMALACNIPYKTAHVALRINGRKPRSGVFTFQLAKALEGFCKPKPLQTIRQPNGRQYTPITLAKAYPKGRYLVYTRGHVMAMVDGEILDWANGKRLRVQAIQEVKL